MKYKTINIPPELHAELKAKASIKQILLKDYVIDILLEYINKK